MGRCNVQHPRLPEIRCQREVGHGGSHYHASEKETYATGEYHLETLREVWDNDGRCVEIGPDRDGLGTVELRSRTDDGTIGVRMCFPVGTARLVARALLECNDELEMKAEMKAEEEINDETH